MPRKEIPFFEIESNHFANTWVRACKLIVNFGYLHKTDFGNFARAISLHISLFDEAIHQIENLELHPQFPTKQDHLIEYLKQFDREHFRRFEEFEYLYLDRFVNYHGIDQLTRAKELLHEGSRRCQLITWMPETDLFNKSAPCLQIIQIFQLDRQLAEVSLVFRSNDIYSAWMSNLCGITKMINDYILKPNDLELKKIKYYCFNSHIYGEFLEEARVLRQLPTYDF